MDLTARSTFNLQHSTSVELPDPQPSTLNPQHLGLPHRPPFVFVKELVRCEPGRAADCRTTFDADEPFFAGHFPGNPLVPGVILTEALAQTAGIAAASASAPVEGSKPAFLLSAIRQMKFLAPVHPRDLIDLRAECIGEAGKLLQFQVEARVGGKVVATGQIVLSRTA